MNPERLWKSSFWMQSYRDNRYQNRRFLQKPETTYDRKTNTVISDD
jgi:hypothetical protein